MGKKKQQKSDVTEKHKEKLKEDKGKKIYSLSNQENTGLSCEVESLPKVSLPPQLERALLDLIQTHTQERGINKEVSNRLTNKKLMDIYSSLSQAGFGHKQIEQAMENTTLHGGDLIDTLDWLCLNTPNDRLPANFSQTLQKEEDEKRRPQFDVSLQRDAAPSSFSVPEVQPLAIKSVDEKPVSTESAQKDWILKYAELGSDDDDDEEEEEAEDSADPNACYLLLTAQMLDAKDEAAEVKLAGNKIKQKEISKRIRELKVEMDSLESHPDFNPEIKISLTSAKKGNKDDPGTKPSHDQPASQSGAKSVPPDMTEDEDMGFKLFQEVEAPSPAPVKDTGRKEKEDFRSFEYTRQQWTGKSPKQFLIDWCRKHLPKSPPPKFEKINPRGNKFKCRVRVDRQKDGVLELCPTILCGNVKEAEHVAATLALYHLCKGQSVYQLLPPVYRDVWLEWSDAEKQAQQQVKDQENKPRDMFLAKLLSKLEMPTKKGTTEVKVRDEVEDTVDTWESLDPEQEDDISVKQRDKGTKTGKKLQSEKGLLEMYKRHSQTGQYQELLRSRQDLPVFQHRDTVLETLARHNVFLIAGETGSGKSTQVPHFILQACLQSSGRCNIVCTEPRRISAISLATRVSQEMGEDRLGGPQSLCGYQIRFESRCGPNTCLTYCTTGVLLRKLQLDPSLKHISHIIVDEVHERSVQSDFLLIIVRRLLQMRPDLKVILMSATLDAQKFSAYFNHCPVINIPGRTFPVQVYHIEDVLEQTGYVLDEDSPYCLRQSDLVKEDQAAVSVTGKGGNQSKLDLFWTTEDVASIDRTDLPAEIYSKKTRNIVSRLNMNRINMDLILELLVYLDVSTEFCQVPGAVLIFLPGLADITELYEILLSDRRFMDTHKYLVIALHSVLSSNDQARAFSVPPSGVRKIVLATNIAETGITIPDVVFVIDTGKVKENRYIETSQMSALEEVFISRANAKQRQGRAGRVQEGFCFRLYTKHMYEEMRPFTVPELLRVPLEELCLHIMKCEYGKPEDFLAQALDPPSSSVIGRAMSLLHQIGACEGGDTLSPLGQHLAALPVHVRIGKMLLYAAVFGCLEPVAVIAAAMTDKSPFVAPLGKQDLANAARQSLAVAASDQLTVYNAYLGWEEARNKGRGAEMSYCQKLFLKRNTLLEIENVKTDLMKLVETIGFTKRTSVQPRDHAATMDQDGVLLISKHQTTRKLDKATIAKVKAILTAGLYPNIAKVKYEAPVDAGVNPDQRVCVGETPQGPAAVHPSSVNRMLQASGWMVYHQKVKSSRVYLRDSTLISPYPLLLFGGEIGVQHTDQVLAVGDRVRYKAYARTGVIFKELRKMLDELLAEKLDNPSTDISSNQLVTLIQDLLLAEKFR